MSTQATTPQEEWLAHYGVKGMKWGVKKPTSNDIHNARARTASRERDLNRQVDKTNLAKPGKAQAKEAQKLNKMTIDYLKNPDRATALRLTKGEKIANSIVAIAVPGLGTAAVGVSVGAQVAIRKAVEKDVANAQAGKYDPKS